MNPIFCHLLTISERLQVFGCIATALLFFPVLVPFGVVFFDDHDRDWRRPLRIWSVLLFVSLSLAVLCPTRESMNMTQCGQRK